MTTHELAKQLLNLPNFKIKAQVDIELSDETLSKMSYPFPHDFIHGILELGDTSYSDEETTIMINIKESDIKNYNR